MHASLDLQPPFEDISHQWYPPSGKTGAFGLLTLGGAPVYAKVYFHDTADIDRTIAELVALRAEMTGEGAPRAADRCTCGHPAYLHGDSITGVHGYCTKCEADACNMFELADAAVTRIHAGTPQDAA